MPTIDSKFQFFDPSPPLQNSEMPSVVQVWYFLEPPIDLNTPEFDSFIFIQITKDTFVL